MNRDGDLTLEEAKRALEGILFVAGEPLGVTHLARTLGAREGTVNTALDALAREYQGRGLRIQVLDGQVQMVTAPEISRQVEFFLGLEAASQLSQAALETLAIVAYRQPVTRAEIEAIRGVNSDGVLNTLQSKGLICEVGRRDSVGHPILYGVTFEFLQHFGLERLDNLPPLPPREHSEV